MASSKVSRCCHGRVTVLNNRFSRQTVQFYSAAVKQSVEKRGAKVGDPCAPIIFTRTLQVEIGDAPESF